MPPKFTLVGFAEICACKPVPVSAIDNDGFEASLVTLRVPVAGVIEVGANCTCTVSVCPAARVALPLPLMTVKTPPDIEAAEMFTASVPVLVTLRGSVAVLPTARLPKLRVVADGVRTPVLVPPPPVPPPPVLWALEV